MVWFGTAMCALDRGQMAGSSPIGVGIRAIVR
jgi:hypothetical protein